MKTIRECKQCGKETDNPKFCSRSCSATYTNTTHPKRHRDPDVVVCPDCGGFKYPQSIRCHACKVLLSAERRLTRSIGNMDKTHLQQHARDTVIGDRACHVCGFTPIVHVAHIKAIASFSPDATLGEVNAQDNLVYLCPNHHAMYDAGLLGPLV